MSTLLFGRFIGKHGAILLRNISLFITPDSAIKKNYILNSFYFRKKKKIFGAVVSMSGNHIPFHPGYLCMDYRISSKFGIVFGTTQTSFNTKLPTNINIGKTKYYSILSYCDINNKFIHSNSSCRIMPPRTSFFKNTDSDEQSKIFNKLVTELNEKDGSLTTLTGDKITIPSSIISTINLEILEIEDKFYDQNIILKNT